MRARRPELVPVAALLKFASRDHTRTARPASPENYGNNRGSENVSET